MEIDHPGRAFLALSVFFRHAGLTNDENANGLLDLAPKRLLERARILGAVLRVAYMVSASMPGVLPSTPMRVERGQLTLRMGGKFKALAGDRVNNRLRALARLIGTPSRLVTD